MSLLRLLARAVVLSTALFVPSACATAPDVGTWGADADWLPGLGRVKSSAHDAFAHPWTWAPALGALVIGVTDLDHDISEWAAKDNPVFGSRENALEQSNDIKGVIADISKLSILATDSGDEAGPWIERKAIGFSAYFLSKGLEVATVDALKESTGRMRYDGSDDRSFPSKHTASAFLSAAWLNTNVDYLPVHANLRKTVKYANLAGAASVAWARVEGGKHYASDVLIGAALGSASAIFFQRLLVGVPEPGEPEVRFSIGPDDSYMIGLNWSF